MKSKREWQNHGILPNRRVSIFAHCNRLLAENQAKVAVVFCLAHFPVDVPVDKYDALEEKVLHIMLATPPS